MNSSVRIRISVLLVLAALVLSGTPGLSLVSAGRVEQVDGRLTIVRGTAIIAARPGHLLYTGDRLATGGNSSAILALGPHRVRMGSEASFLVSRVDVEHRRFNLFLWVGRLWLYVQKGTDAVEFTVDTPAAQAGVRGTLFSVAVAADGTTWVGVSEGKVAVTALPGGQEIRLKPGFGTSVKPGERPGKPKSLKKDEVGGEDLKKDKGKGNGQEQNGNGKDKKGAS